MVSRTRSATRANGRSTTATVRPISETNPDSESHQDPVPEVIAVVLTWNDTEMSTACIGSVLASDYPAIRVVVVDNGSSEPCGEKLKEIHPSVDLVVLPANQGFAGGANRGLERALELGCEYALLLNNDTVLEPDAVSLLVGALAESGETGAATTLLLEPGEEKRVEFYTGRIARDRAAHFHDGKGMLLRDGEWPTTRTEFAPACALMFRARALREVGLFDEEFGTNWEDYDLCVRFMDEGWPMLTVGDARVVHLHGATTGRQSPYITYYGIRNRLICLFRHGRPWPILRSSPWILRSLYWQIRDHGFANWACHRALAKGVLDFLLGVRGEGSVPRSREG